MTEDSARVGTCQAPLPGDSPEELELDLELRAIWAELERVRALFEPELWHVLGCAIRAAYALGLEGRR